MNKTISDIISVEDMKSWHPDTAVFITASTGKGKSHFIKNKFYDYAKARGEKILLILHRKNCHQQFEHELTSEGKDDVITTITYQTIEQRVIYEKSFNFSPYTYIVCDEYHYFLEDADFNPFTDLSFRAILQSNKIMIFLSATGVDMKDYMTSACGMPSVEYELQEEDMHIRQLSFFDDMKTVPAQIAQRVINAGEKAIFFIQSAEDAWELRKQLGSDAIFNCSQYNKRWHKRVDSKAVKSMLQNESFEVPILVTTSCFDAGINIKDKHVTTILVDITNVTTVIQCIGRRRIDYTDPNDRIDVYVHVPSRKSLNGVIMGKTRNIAMADFLMENGARAFIQKYPRKIYPSLIYDNPYCSDWESFKCVNRIKYHKDLVDIHRFKSILDEPSGYQHLIAERLRRIDPETGDYLYEEIDGDYMLSELLEGYITKPMLVPADREPLIQAINVQSGDKTLRRVASLNEALERRNYPYQIVQFCTSRMENGKKVNYNHAWRVERRP